MFLHRITYRDLIAATAVLLCAALLWLSPVLFADEGEWLEISTPDGTQRYALSEDRTVTLTSRGITICIIIENGAARVESSDCPDRVCVASHSAKHTGDTILCAPAGVKLTVKGGERDVDFVAG